MFNQILIMLTSCLLHAYCLTVRGSSVHIESVCWLICVWWPGGGFGDCVGLFQWQVMPRGGGAFDNFSGACWLSRV